ncbi:MAG: purine-nucleoside phosphorylase [bacterium]|nr:purine-nucleoside phosphorylase [bacterium]
MTMRSAAPGPALAKRRAAEAAALERALAPLRGRFGETPGVRLAVVTGSGLGGVARFGCEIGALDYGEIPELGAGRVAGHDGRWSLMDVGGRPVFCLCGRRHLYEGISPWLAGLSMRLLARLAVRDIILTNAAGGLSPRLAVGDLMLVAGHLNLMFRRLGFGRPAGGAGSGYYDPVLAETLRQAALETGVALREGIYAALTGPAYETPAEVDFLRRLGADAVGMSTVPEVVAARESGLRVAAVSVITNSHVCAGSPLTHEEVLAAGERSADQLAGLLRRAIERDGGE